LQFLLIIDDFKHSSVDRRGQGFLIIVMLRWLTNCELIYIKQGYIDENNHPTQITLPSGR
jgi:hypothetical protein